MVDDNTNTIATADEVELGDTEFDFDPPPRIHLEDPPSNGRSGMIAMWDKHITIDLLAEGPARHRLVLWCWTAPTVYEARQYLCYMTARKAWDDARRVMRGKRLDESLQIIPASERVDILNRVGVLRRRYFTGGSR